MRCDLLNTKGRFFLVKFEFILKCMCSILRYLPCLQPLGMKKGDGEKAVQEIGKGSNVKRGTQCPVVQVHVRLLSVILYETDEP
jgi:hypothetical protein